MTKSTMVQHLRIESIRESATNPRRTFKNMPDLIESVREKGVLSPIIVRPLGDLFEVVFGARRLRAAIAVGLREIPAFVRVLSDREALELQVIENLQREDVPPLEEAEGFLALHRDHGYSVEDLAAKTGKPTLFIRKRLALCSLPANAREALAPERMTLGVAQLVARLPANVQEEATDTLLKVFTDDDEPLSLRRAQEELDSRYLLDLADAPWDLTDASLYPEAGACATCPRRTGSQPELFADVKATDTCTDPTCFTEKKNRVWQLRVVRAEEQGQAVVDGKAAKHLFAGDGAVMRDAGFYALDAVCEQDPKGRTWRRVLGKKLPPVHIARDQAGRVHELVRREEVTEVAATKGIELPKLRSREVENEAWKKRQERERRAYDLRRAVADQIRAVIADKVTTKGVDTGALRIGVRLLVANPGGDLAGVCPDLAGREDVTTEEVTKALRKVDTEALLAVFFNLAVAPLLGNAQWDGYPDGLEEFARHFRLDLKAAEKRVRAEMKAAAKAGADAADEQHSDDENCEDEGEAGDAAELTEARGEGPVAAAI